MTRRRHQNAGALAPTPPCLATARCLPLFGRQEVSPLEEAEAIVLGSGTTLVESLAGVFVLAQLVTLVALIVVMVAAERALLFGTMRRRRVFRCPLMKREVEVELEQRRWCGVLRGAEVKSSAVFEVPTAIECRRACPDSAFRRQWEFAVPVLPVR